MAVANTMVGTQARGGVERAERRFFLYMALAMATVIVGGFAFNLAMGRSTFSVPLVYHLHAVVYLAWIALYVAQNALIATNRVTLHRRVGALAILWVPLMVALGLAIMVTSLRRTGGPFFFDQNEFLVSNTLLLCCFAVMVFVALQCRRYTGWHRRLMLTAMSILTGPGLGRLLPMPLMMPHAWRIMMVITLIFPIIGMIADRRRLGYVHPAWFWGVGAIIAVQTIADVIAYSDAGVALTEYVIDGSAGAERPMHAFLPPGPGP